MRKNYQMWLLGALFGGLVLPFAGCSNEDDPISNEQGNGETFETELTIALKTGNGTKTRATSTETQNASGSFNGMTDIRLVSYGGDFKSIFNDGVQSNLTNEYYAPKSDASNSIISVTALTDLSSAVVDDDQLYDASQYYFKQKDNIELNQATQAFLFYGKSSYAGVGDLSVNIPSSTNSTVNQISFDLVEKTQPDALVYETLMEEYLAGVYLALYNYNPAYLDKTQAASADEAVSNVYNNIVLAESGAFNQIAYLMAQLYVLADNSGLTASNPAGSSTTEDIKNAIYQSGVNEVIFTAKPTGTYSSGQPISGLTYTTVSDGLATALDTYELPTIYELNFHDLTVSSGVITKTDLLTAQADNIYARPAALYYYVNSYPVDYSTTDFDALNWRGGSLDNLTDAADLDDGVPSKVAMAHTAQYAVGRLDVTLAEGTGTDGNIPDREGTTVSFSDLVLKAILIGNQTEVGWNFLPKGSDEKVIYDNEFEGSTGKTDSPWQVLALPSTPGAAVNIALEMVNNGSTSFVGKNGQIIPAGATFYLTAPLNPNNVTNTTSVANPAVFMSDYYTTVTLTLSNLRNAENTVPDLSGSNLEFALSVDLEWEKGLSFNVDIQ